MGSLWHSSGVLQNTSDVLLLVKNCIWTSVFSFKVSIQPDLVQTFRATAVSERHSSSCLHILLSAVQHAIRRYTVHHRKPEHCQDGWIPSMQSYSALTLYILLKLCYLYFKFKVKSGVCFELWTHWIKIVITTNNTLTCFSHSSLVICLFLCW